MSRERTGENGSLEDAPDWFDAGEGTATASGAEERGWIDDAEVGDWFTDPDHEPIGPGTEGADESTDEAVTSGLETTDEDSETVAEATGTTAEPAEPAEPAETVDDAEVAAETEVAEVAEGTSETTDLEAASSTAEPTPEPDERGTADDEMDVTTTQPTLEDREVDSTESADTDDTESSIGRLIAWLRSVFGLGS